MAKEPKKEKKEDVPEKSSGKSCRELRWEKLQKAKK